MASIETSSGSGSAPSKAALAMGLLALAQLIISVDYNIVYVALPQIGTSLGFSAQSLQWVVSGYALGFGGLLLLGGRAVDRLGARRMFLAALCLYGIASMLGGLAQSPQILIAARILQGTGSALLFPATLSLVSIRFAEGAERNRAMSIWGVAGASGVIFGAAGGGLLTSTFGWQAVFFAKAPFVLLALAGGLTLLPKDKAIAKGRFDLLGGLTATIGASLLVFGLIRGPEAGWLAPDSMGAIASGLVFLVLFIGTQKWGKDPLAPLSLFTHRWLVTAILALFILQGTINAAHYIAFLFMQNGLAFDAFASGLGFLPVSFLAMFASAKLMPWLLERAGLQNTLIIGAIGIGAALIALALSLHPGSSYWQMLPAFVLWGLMAGMVYPAMFVAATTGVPAERQGVASGMASAAGQIGGAVVLAGTIAIANAGMGVSASIPEGDVLASLQIAGFWGAGLSLLAAILIRAIRPR